MHAHLHAIGCSAIRLNCTIAALVAFGVAACTSSSSSVIGPSDSKCQVSVGSSLETVPPAGGMGTLTITAERDCTWTVSTTAAWIVVTEESSGQGSGSVTFSVAANAAPSRRTGTLGVNDAQVSVSQEAAPCAFRVSQSTSAVPASGGEVTLRVEAVSGCTWAAASDAPWIQVASGTQGNGEGSARLTVPPNSGPPRTGRVRIADQTVTVTQADGTTSCETSLTPATHNMSAEGGPATVSVTAPPTCQWTATSGVDWILITSGATATGTARVELRVGGNPSTALRQGSIAIGSQTFSVTQAGVSCSYNITPTARTVGAGRGSTSVAVAASPGCSWSASANVEWISVRTGATGSGSGTVTLSVPGNTGETRTGTVSIAGQTFTLTQTASSCSYSIAPRNHASGSGGGTGTVSVASAGHCAWTAASNASWLTVVNGSSGSGNGTVGFRVAANTGAQRTGRLTIGGETFTVTQSAPDCDYNISPSSFPAPVGGGTGTVSVTSAGHCSWQAEAQDPWITIASGASGTGNGTVRFSVGANPGGERSGELRVAGHTFTVTQAASTCGYTISQSSFEAGNGGGAGTVSVAAAGHCAWTAASNVPWVSVSSGATGAGNGEVAFRVDPNLGPARSGTLAIAGHTFTVNQLSLPCAYQITPTSQSVAAAGSSGTIAVTTPGACSWGAASNVPWILLTGATSGTGNAGVAYTVSANPGEQRTGTVTVAGQTFTVTQAAEIVSCTYGVTPSGGSVEAAGGPGTFAVTAGGTCSWTAVPTVPWLNVTAGASGTGGGTVSFLAAVNPAEARSGTISVMGQMFTVTQAAACNYSIAPSSGSVEAVGGSGMFAVTAGGTCSWTATSTVPWLSVTTGASGTGNGTVAFTATPNPGELRSGAITVMGQTFTVTQLALAPPPPPPCSYSIAPMSQAVPVEGGSGSVAVTAAGACGWTAASGADWIVVTSGASGTGNGAVGFSVTPNTGVPRSGSITIAGQGFTVTQAGTATTP